MSTDQATRVMAVMLLLSGVWVVFYWLWEPAGAGAVEVARPAGDGTVGEPAAIHDPLVDAGSGAEPPEGPAAQQRTTGAAPTMGAAGDTPSGAAISAATLAAPTGTRPAAGGQAPTFREYVVQPNDTLQEISRKFFGTTRYDTRIARARGHLRLPDPDRLRVGQVLLIPLDPNNITGIPEGDDAPPLEVPTAVEYRVTRGDSFSTIAQREYGSARHWRFLFEFNAARVRDDPKNLRIGQTILIPPLPAQGEDASDRQDRDPDPPGGGR